MSSGVTATVPLVGRLTRRRAAVYSGLNVSLGSSLGDVSSLCSVLSFTTGSPIVPVR